MDPLRAGAVAVSLMYEHGLRHWLLVWGLNGQWARPGPRGWVAARCVMTTSPPCIVLNRRIVELNEEKDVRDVILHEIAHALTDGDHDEVWRFVAKRIGCSGEISPVLVVPDGDGLDGQTKIGWRTDV